MLLFRKNIKNKTSVAKEAPIEIINKWKASKRKLAAYLQQKSELLSIAVKRYSLIFFCLLFGGSSIAIIIHSVSTKQNTVSATNISKPLHTTPNEETTLRPDTIITKREYDRVSEFKNYLVHLRADSTGRKKFDSIVANRPKLIDSINLFEKMYLSQK